MGQTVRNSHDTIVVLAGARLLIPKFATRKTTRIPLGLVVWGNVLYSQTAASAGDDNDYNGDNIRTRRRRTTAKNAPQPQVRAAFAER